MTYHKKFPIKDNLKWILEQSKGRRFQVFMNCAIGVIIIGLNLFFVWICKKSVDIATHKSDGVLLYCIIALVLAQVLRIALRTYSNYLATENRVFLNTRMRSKMFERIMRVQWNGDDKYHSGDIVNRIQTDGSTITGALTSDIPSFVLTIVQLISASVFLFAMQPQLLFVLLLVTPVAIVVSRVFYKKMHNISMTIRECDSDVQSLVTESIQNRNMIKSMDRVPFIMNLLTKIQTKLIKYNLHRLSISQRANVAMSCGFMAGYLTTFIWGVYGLESGVITYGMMTAFLQLVAQVQNPIVGLSQYVPSWIGLMTATDRLREIWLLEQEKSSNAVSLGDNVGVRVQNVSFTYAGNATKTLTDINYTFLPGTSTAIVGETGSGKSTLIRLLLSLLTPDSGEITIYNESCSASVSAATRCNFMYVPQGNTLLSGTVRDNLLMGNPDATEEQMREALEIACAQFVFQKENGLDTICSEKGGGLSEGQAQRISIARALLHPGAILILDEASSALDVQTEKSILEQLSTRMTQKTIIWITHHKAVEQYMDHCLVIEPQRINNSL